MKKTFSILTVNFILIILLIGIFISVIPTASAGPLMDAYTVKTEVKIYYDTEVAEDPFMPIDMVKEIPIDLQFRMTGLYANEIVDHLASDETFFLFVYLSVEDTPAWSSASILPTIVFVRPTSDYVSYNGTLSVNINEKVEAFADGDITIKAYVEGIGSIQEGHFFQNVTFVPGFRPILQISTKETTKMINPNEVADFNIEIENLGNADTLVDFDYLDLPEGWKINIPDTRIETGTLTTNGKRNIKLSVKPPDSFGYHNEREIIELTAIPKYVIQDFEGNYTLEGEEYYISFIVQSRGFSTPGYEAVFVIIAFACIALFIKKKDSGGKNKK